MTFRNAAASDEGSQLRSRFKGRLSLGQTTPICVGLDMMQDLGEWKCARLRGLTRLRSRLSEFSSTLLLAVAIVPAISLAACRQMMTLHLVQSCLADAPPQLSYSFATHVDILMD